MKMKKAAILLKSYTKYLSNLINLGTTSISYTIYNLIQLYMALIDFFSIHILYKEMR